MKDHAREMLKAEYAYLAIVESRLESARGKQLHGSIWKTSRHDDSDRLRAIMANHRVYDRRKVGELPHNRRIAIHGFERNWWFRKNPTGVAIASVLNPLDSIVGSPEQTPPPIDLTELIEHVRRIVGDDATPHIIGICAPSGFTEDARRCKIDLPNVSLVLVEPQKEGGWRISTPDESLPAHVLEIFDPEVADQKIDRVRERIQSHSADLLTGGISAETMSAKLNVPQKEVSAAIAQMAAEDPELYMTQKDGDVLLYRGVAAKPEKTSMSVVDRIRQLFAKEGDEGEKINVLAERRAQLSSRRDRLYEDIGRMETREADLLKQGKEASSSVVRRRVAAQLAQVRKDVARQNTTAGMLNQQINIISTDIHNLTLIMQGNVAQLPDTEELTENAVKAEEMLETLNADAAMVASLETGLADIGTSDEEMAILKEFETVDEPAESTPVRKSESVAKRKSSDADVADTEQPSKRADPEAS